MNCNSNNHWFNIIVDKNFEGSIDTFKQLLKNSFFELGVQNLLSKNYIALESESVKGLFHVYCDIKSAEELRKLKFHIFITELNKTPENCREI